MKVSINGLCRNAAKDPQYKYALGELCKHLKELRDDPRLFSEFFALYVFNDEAEYRETVTKVENRPGSKSFQEWYAFFGGEEMDISKDDAAVVWYAATMVVEKRLTGNVLRMSSLCTWTREEFESSAFETSCGEMFMFEGDGHPHEAFKFCCYCGKPMTKRAALKALGETPVAEENLYGR